MEHTDPDKISWYACDEDHPQDKLSRHDQLIPGKERCRLPSTLAGANNLIKGRPSDDRFRHTHMASFRLGM